MNTVFLERGSVVFLIFQMGLYLQKRLRIVTIEFYHYACVMLQAFHWEVTCMGGRWSSFRFDLRTIPSTPTAQAKAGTLPQS